MGKGLFITGTGTDVGKTYITGLIVKKMHEAGYNTAYYKAAMSGNTRKKDGTLLPGDAAFVKRISGIAQSLEEMCPYVYEKAVSPHLASRIEGNPVKLEVVRAGFQKVLSAYDYVLMEGSGGICCPICFDEVKLQLEDIVKELGLSSILVADAGLGTINNVVLTCEYMKQRELTVKAIIFNNFHPGNMMEEDNLHMCEYMTDLPVIACVKKYDTNLDIDVQKLIAQFE